MFCPNCGNNISDDAKFCNKCGWKNNKRLELTNLLKSNLKFAIPLAVIIIIIIVFIANLFKPKVYDFKDIKKVKLVTKYSKNTTVDKMDTVKFGNYPQSDESGDKKEPIEWIVLERDKEKALLLSKYVLDHQRDTGSGDVTWENSTIRNWLNRTFYNSAFDVYESKYVLSSFIKDTDDTVRKCNITTDNLFFLSKSEIKKYFDNSNKKLITKGTNYARHSNPVTDIFGYTYYLSGDEFLERDCGYWLRSAAYSTYDDSDDDVMYYITMEGNVSAIDSGMFSIGVRPAMYVYINFSDEGVPINYSHSGDDNISSSGGSISNDVSYNSSSSNEPINRKTDTSQVDTKKSYKEIKNINSSEKYSQETSIEKMDTVSFGTYENNGSKEGIEWIVLEKNDSEAILLSKYILDCQQYNSVKQNMTWEESGIRKWLNGTFFTTAFSSDEQNRILDSYIENNDNVKAWTKGGNPTADKVYLLSIDECIKYFGEPNATNQIVKLSTYGTAYAKNKGLYIDSDASAWHNGYSPFWLRSPGVQQSRAGVVNYCGYFYADGNSVDFKLNGVRPVIKIKLN